MLQSATSVSRPLEASPRLTSASAPASGSLIWPTSAPSTGSKLSGSCLVLRRAFRACSHQHPGHGGFFRFLVLLVFLFALDGFDCGLQSLPAVVALLLAAAQGLARLEQGRVGGLDLLLGLPRPARSRDDALLGVCQQAMERDDVAGAKALRAGGK